MEGLYNNECGCSNRKNDKKINDMFLNKFKQRAIRKKFHPLQKSNPALYNNLHKLPNQPVPRPQRAAVPVKSGLIQTRKTASLFKPKSTMVATSSAAIPASSVIPKMEPIVQKPAMFSSAVPAQNSIIPLVNEGSNAGKQESQVSVDPLILPSQEVKTAGIGGNKLLIGLIGSAVLGYFLLGGKDKKDSSPKGLSGVKRTTKKRNSAKPATASKKKSGRRMQVISL